MTRVVEVLNRVARKCSITPPSGWVTATSLTHVELRDDYLQETLDDLRKRVDFPSPITATTTITGDGGATYSLPSDFVRLQFGEDAVYDKSRLRRWGAPLAGDGNWSRLSDMGTGGGNRYYRVKGYDAAFEIEFYPALESGGEVEIGYVTDKWLVNAGIASSTFTAEDDIILFPRRVVENGTIFRFRMDKGLDYASEQTQYEAWVISQANNANGIKAIRFGGGDARKPMRVDVPDFIPGA